MLDSLFFILNLLTLNHENNNIFIGTGMLVTLQSVFAQECEQVHIVETNQDDNNHHYPLTELPQPPDYLSETNEFVITSPFNYNFTTTTPYRMGRKRRYHYYFKNDVYSGSLFDDPSMNAYTRKAFKLPRKIHSQAQLRLRNKAPPERVLSILKGYTKE